MAPKNSTKSVKNNIFFKTEKSELGWSVSIKLLNIKWLRKDIPPLNNIAKKLVKVINPNPPIWIKTNKISIPKSVNLVGTSTVERPVTQTALVAVNNESIKLRFPLVAFGMSNMAVPQKIKKLKDMVNNTEGLNKEFLTSEETDKKRRKKKDAISKYRK